MSVRISTVNEYTLKCPTIPHPPYVYKYAACHHYIHNTTCICHPSTSIFPHPSFIRTTFYPFLPDLCYMELILGNFEDTPTHTLTHTHTHYRTNLRVSKLVQFSLQFQLPLWKKLCPVHSSRWETLFQPV